MAANGKQIVLLFGTYNVFISVGDPHTYPQDPPVLVLQDPDPLVRDPDPDPSLFCNNS
jgi:hypothetical protein